MRRTAVEGWGLIAAGGAAAVALLLRLDEFTSVPYRAPNPDEWNWSWSGLSQLLGMAPTGWTLFFKAYPKYVWQPPPPPYTEPLVHPWVDAPPVFSWIVGLFVWLTGDRTLDDVIADPRPRLIGIALSVTALVLAYWLGKVIFGVWPALIGAWLLAVSPIPVVLGRLVAAEQVLAVLLLLALIAVFHLRREPYNRRWLWIVVACCALAPAVKATGLAVGASAALLFLTGRQWRMALTVAAATGIAQVLVIAYSAAINWSAYVETVAIRGSQLSGFTGLRFITNTTGFDRQQAFDGWWLLGWLAVAELLARRRTNDDLVAVPAVVYLLVMLGTAAEYSSGYGWYRLTVMPLIYLAAGRFLWLAAVELSWVRLALVAVAAIATLQNFATALNLNFGPVFIAVIVAIAVLPAFAALALRELRPWSRAAVFGLFVLLIPVGVLEVSELGSIYGHL